MFKRIMAMLLSVVMIASMTTVVMAAPSTIKGALTQFATENGENIDELTTREVSVEADINVAVKNTGVWKDSHTETVPKSDISTVVYQAAIDMTNVRTTFNLLTNLAGSAITQVGGSNDLKESIKDTLVKGEFDIVITYPQDYEEEAQEIANGTNMAGFDAESKKLFSERAARSIDLDSNTITIKIKVGNGTATANAGYATHLELANNLSEELTFDFSDGVKPSTYGEYRVTGELSGWTEIYEGSVAEENKLGRITYSSNTASALVEVKEPQGGSVSRDVTVRFFDGKEVVKTVTEKYVVQLDLSTIVPEAKEGYTFVGWYRDKELTKRASTQFKVINDTDLYAKWQVFGGPVLQTEDHFAYIIGYTDGTVRPLNNIIREEVAAIFFRLLTEEAGEAMHEEIAPYSDVPQTKWSSTPIATLAKGGYITGRPDGTFAPEADITRAEFATIAARFSGDVETGETNFSDVDGHWAENYIKVCVANGWITGYTDGTFKPDQNITRAEAMAIVNRMLGRAVDAKGIEAVADDIYYFGDNPEGTWCYYIVLEATNSHDYDRAEGETYETWTKVTEIRDWAAYEK